MSVSQVKCFPVEARPAAPLFQGLCLLVDEVRRMPVLHPASKRPLPGAWIDLRSNDSSAARAFDNQLTEDRLKNPDSRRTAADIEGLSADRLAVLTVGWNLVTLSGARLDIPFNMAAARELYAEAGMSWLREQVVKFVFDAAPWMPGTNLNSVFGADTLQPAD